MGKTQHWIAVTIAILPSLCAAQVSTPLTSQSPAQIPPQDSPTLHPGITVEGEGPRYVAPTTRDSIGRIWARVMINGKGPFRLVLDTGANSSAITPAVAERLGLTQQATQQSNKAQLIGVTGTGAVSMVNVDSMEVGDISLGATRLAVLPDVFGGAEGVLSPKGLTDKRIFIDFRNDAIRITGSNKRGVEPGFFRVPITVDHRQLLMFDIRVGGVKTKAILSTGGQTTIGNDALREALLKRIREGKEQDIVGVTLDVTQGRRLTVPPIAIGGLSLSNVQITFADTYIFDKWKLTHEPAMIIGMDVIGSMGALVIDYKEHDIQIRPRQ